MRIYILTLSPSHSSITITTSVYFFSFHFSVAIFYGPLLLSLCASEIPISGKMLEYSISCCLHSRICFCYLCGIWGDHSFSLLNSIVLCDKTYLIILMSMVILSFSNLESSNATHIFYRSLGKQVSSFPGNYLKIASESWICTYTISQDNAELFLQGTVLFYFPTN